MPLNFDNFLARTCRLQSDTLYEKESFLQEIYIIKSNDCVSDIIKVRGFFL